MNAIELLTQDHRKVSALLAELAATTPRALKTRATLLDSIAHELEIHTSLEEEIFYPAFKAAGQDGDDDKMYFEALEEHRAAGEMVLPDLLATDPGSEQFSGRAKVLRELIEHHAGEEEKEMFPRARELFDAAQLRALGEAMAQRRIELAANPESKAAKAANRMISAVVAAISPTET